MVVVQERLKDEQVKHGRCCGNWAVELCWEPSSLWSLTVQLQERHDGRLEVWTAYERSFSAAGSPRWKKWHGPSGGGGGLYLGFVCSPACNAAGDALSRTPLPVPLVNELVPGNGI